MGKCFDMHASLIDTCTLTVDSHEGTCLRTASLDASDMTMAAMVMLMLVSAKLATLKTAVSMQKRLSLLLSFNF